MVVKHCVYKDCESDSRYWEREYMRGVCFIRFPNALTHRERCEKWVMACDRRDFTIDCVNDNTYICSKHFVGGNGPTAHFPNPIPPNQLLEENLKNKSIENNSHEINERNIHNINNNNINRNDNKLKFNEYKQDFKLRENQLFKCNLNKSCDKNESLNNSLVLTNKLINESTNSTHINFNSDKCSVFELKQEHNVIHIESDDSLKDNNECTNHLMTDYVFIPSCSSNTTTINSHQISPQLVSNDNNRSEVTNNSIPILIIPSTNHTMISSSLSAPVMSINDKNQWFNHLFNDELYIKLAKLGLSVGSIGQRVILSSISGCVVDKQLIIDKSGNFDVKVFGDSVSAQNHFYKSVPILITNQLELNSVINRFSLWKVCAANEIIDRVFEDKIIAIRAFVCNISNTIRSRSCQLLIPENSSIRCKSCKILLNRIRRFKYSHLKDIKTNRSIN